MTEKGQTQIRDLVTEMHLAAPAKNALIETASKLYDETIENKIAFGVSRSIRAATAIFLACDGNACIALPKVKRACGSCISMKQISKVRNALHLARGTAHEKLNSICQVCSISNRKFITMAHFFVSLLEKEGCFRPTTMAATAFWSAGMGLDLKERLTQNEISKLTGCTELSIHKLSNVLHLRLAAFDEKEIDNGCETKPIIFICGRV